SSSRSSAGLANAGRNMRSMSCAVSLPPEPWPMSTWRVSEIGTGQSAKGTAAGSEDIVFSHGDVELIPQHVQERRVHLLDAMDRPGADDEGEVAQIGDGAAVTAGEADGQEALFARGGER